jgi:hypothetical protein
VGKPAPEKRQKSRPEKPKCHFCKQPLEGPMLVYKISTPTGVGYSHIESETHHVPVEIRHRNVIGEPSHQPLHMWEM